MTKIKTRSNIYNYEINWLIWIICYLIPYVLKSSKLALKFWNLNFVIKSLILNNLNFKPLEFYKFKIQPYTIILLQA